MGFSEKKTYGPYRSWRKFDNLTVASGTSLTSHNWVDKPDTIKRQKPVDLFASTTARTVKSFSYENIRDGLIDDTDTGYATQAPYSFWGGYPSYRNAATGDFSITDGKLRGKIKDQVVNLAQSCVEYRQTGDLMYGLARDIVRTYRSARSGRGLSDFVRSISHPRSRTGKSAADRWLQYQYGWLPTMSDIYGLSEVIARRVQEGIPHYKRASHTSSVNDQWVSGLFRNTHAELFTIRTKARYIVREPKLKSLAQVGFTNPAHLVWELLPYSFVVDWFIPVGDYLSSLDALVGVEDLVVARSSDRLRRIESVGVNPVFDVSPASLLVERERIRYGVNNNLALPTLRYKPSITLAKLVNAAALVRQLFK